ncbi:hypothetical protein Hanom_Chr03g00246651 [Helianthus anomalus]
MIENLQLAFWSWRQYLCAGFHLRYDLELLVGGHLELLHSSGYSRICNCNLCICSGFCNDVAQNKYLYVEH